MQTYQSSISFKIKSFLKKNVAKKVEPGSQFRFERRALGIIPHLRDTGMEANWAGREFVRQLLFIENNEQTCCIKMSSERFLSRSALLIFRGRLIGSIYGNRKNTQQLFGAAARQCIFRDLSDLDSNICCYKLSEKYALSVASLFEGAVFSVASWVHPEVALTRAHYFLLKNGKPGLIAMSDRAKGGVTFCIYYFAGRILGAYSFFDGWLKPDFQTGERDLGLAEDPSITAFALDQPIDEFLRNSSTSLTGLADRRIEDWLPQEQEPEQYFNY